MMPTTTPPFPIDVVWTWCGLLNKIKQVEVIRKTSAIGLCECGLDLDMMWSMRSAWKNMRWFRRAYVVVDDIGMLPKWLRNIDNDRLIIIEHDQIIPAKYLPTYNSNVVDTYLYSIPGLSEHFLVMDQDHYIGRPTNWTEFFNPQGVPINRHYPGPTRHKGATDNMYARMWLSAIKDFDIDNTRIQHTVQPYNTKLLRKYAKRYAKAIDERSKNRFRAPNDFNLLRFTTAWTSTSGEAVRSIVDDEHVDYFVESPDKKNVERILQLKPQFFCINNTHPSHKHTYEVLKKMFPLKSAFEA